MATVTSEEIGKWLPDVEGGGAPSSIPCHVEQSSGAGNPVSVPGLFRLADPNTRRGFAALVEGAIERGALVPSTLDDVTAVGVDADLSASPFAGMLPTIPERQGYPGLDPAKYARPPYWLWQEWILAETLRILRRSGFHSEPEGRGLHIFVPFTLGKYSGDTWTRVTPTSAGEVFPTLDKDSSPPASAYALGQTVCKALAKFGLCLPDTTGSWSLAFDDYLGTGTDALTQFVLKALALASYGSQFYPFPYYIGGMTDDDKDYSDVPDSDWNPTLEGRNCTMNALSQFDGLWIPIVRAFANGDEYALNAIPANLDTGWDIAIHNGVMPFASSSIYAGERFNGFLYAAAAITLARLSPFGLFTLAGEYAASSGATAVSRLAAGIYHAKLALSCIYSVSPVIDETTNKWTGEVTVSYSAGYEPWTTGESLADGKMEWSVSAPSVTSNRGHVTEVRKTDYDVPAYIADAFLAGSSGADSIQNTLANWGFTDFNVRQPNDKTKDWIWVDQNECTIIFAKFDFASIKAMIDNDGAPELYRTVNDPTVSESIPAAGNVSLSARMPGVSPALHGDPDLTGLRDYPCRGAIAGGYASGGNLWSLWAGTVTGAGTGDESPVHAIPKSAYTLQSGDATPADATAFKSAHVDAARQTAERAFPLLRNGDTYTVTDASGTEVTKSRNYLFSRDAIETLGQELHDAFPPKSEIEAAVSKVEGDGGWGKPNLPTNCAVMIWVNADGSIRRIRVASSSGAYFVTYGGIECIATVEFKLTLTVSEYRTAGTFGVDLANDYYPDLAHYDPWSASLAFGGCLGAFDWAWKAIKLG